MTDHMTRHIAAAVITGDYRVTKVELDATRTLDELYRLIQCQWVVVVALDENVHMWLDDEGMSNNSAPNWASTKVARTFGFTTQPYFGTAVFTGGVDGDGNCTPLRTRDLQRLTAVITE